MRQSRPVLCAVGAMLVWMAGQMASAADGAPVRFDCIPSKVPPLVIKGDRASTYPNGKPAGFRGFADPCIRQDPETKQLWLVYSWPHMEHMGGGRRDFVTGVETHLASSTNGGQSWQFDSVLWPRTPARYTDRRSKKKVDGFVSHEVPNIIPIEWNGEQAWVGARLDYFLTRTGNYRGRDNRSWVARIMVAPTLHELKDAPYVTFGDTLNTTECEVDYNGPQFDRNFPKYYIPNEPALCYLNGRVYFSFVCMTFKRVGQPDFPKSFIPVFSAAPDGPIREWEWTYHGALAGHTEASELGGEALTQTEFAFGRDGKLLALVTPETWDPKAAKQAGGDAFFGILHKECVVVEVASLDKPALARRPDGTLAVRAVLHSSVLGKHGPGAAAYDPASETGILFTLRHMAKLASMNDLSWTLHPTKLHP